MDLPNGTTMPLSTLSIRATEYTVGDTGPAAMPATCPPTSAYTYAVEYSADEALAAVPRWCISASPYTTIWRISWGSRWESACRPATTTGAAIPGCLSRRCRGQDTVRGWRNGSTRCQWSGLSATASARQALGVTDAELALLGQRYQPGQTLWRVPISPFTPWDLNWPPFRQTTQSPLTIPTTDSATDNPPTDDPDNECGSIIETRTRF